MATNLNSDQAQEQHERLQREATEYFAVHKKEPPAPHFGGCWCCCWDDPCESLNFEEVIANDPDEG